MLSEAVGLWMLKKRLRKNTLAWSKQVTGVGAVFVGAPERLVCLVSLIKHDDNVAIRPAPPWSLGPKRSEAVGFFRRDIGPDRCRVHFRSLPFVARRTAVA
ncbi:hypothetical protein [Candidatus Methylacidithermus pantelleriae]|uniref:hypothetical protein n=1 Tax=Candidatus Methylacidithermus pantelleriae TaxID=2744239 RepID=UPI001BD4E65B|nr:hypothetical protein [Candidatus Methylacidithermus pantelleriae]